MRFDCGASLSVVNSGDLLGDRFRASVEVFGIDRADHDRRQHPAATRSSISALLDRGGRLLGILELQIVVRQLALRLLDAGFGDLPEVGGAVDDEGERLLVGGRGSRRDRQGECGRQASDDHALHPVFSSRSE